MNEQPSRRDLMKLAGVAAAGLCLPGSPAQARPTPAGRPLRIAHLTDIHVQPELRANEGMSACLRHVNGLKDRPDLIVTGGDQIMDAFDQGRERSQVLWDLWNSCLKSDNSIPARHVLGNHDIWGWNKKKSKCTGDEPGYGKAWACEQFARSTPYTSFDQQGWHIVLLDSVQPKGDGYVGRLDEEQFAWLEADLRAAGSAPVAVFSHIPIFAVCVYSDSAKKKDDPDNWYVSGGLMHSDAHRIRKLFMKHPNVKLCVSGHIHQVDRVEYCGVTYICDGAVSGRWWKGRHAECDEGYGLFDLHPDGTFSHQYQTFGWKAAT
jgi:3',5'-cyclic-AMP phosphodiesterase